MKPLALLILLLSMVGCGQTVNNDIEIVSPKKVLELLKNKDVQLIDVRTPEEYESGFIRHAKNINFYDSTFSSQIEKLDKDRPVIVYCKLGGRSAKSAKKFQEVGFSKIYDLEGGFTRWKKEDHPVKMKD